jgi:cobalamin biosynthesis protein CobW
VRHMLANAKGRRIALIINEFGDLGVDGEILKACGNEACSQEDIIELSNGCICCTVADDFIPTMQKLLDSPRKPDHIVIETSGLALPQPLVRAFNWPEIKSRVTVDSVVTVVDAKALSEGRFADDEAAIAAQRAADPNVDHENPIQELFNDQLNSADLILLNKSDLLSTGELQQLNAQLKPRLRKGASLLQTSQGILDVGVLLGQDASAEDDMHNRLSTHEMEGETQHDHDDFVTFSVDLPNGLDQKTLLARINAVIESHDILRLKGFAHIPDTTARLLIQAVGPRLNSYFDRPWHENEKRQTRLVVIGEKAIDQMAIAAALHG